MDKVIDSTKKTRVALYGRVSTERQARHGDSLADQRDTLLQWAKTMDWEVAGLYIDEGVTGKTDNRPQLKRLMLDAHAGKFDLLAVPKLDRFYRKERLLQNCVYELDQLHIGFLCQSEGLDTRVPGMTRIYLSMLGSMAEYEVERMGERQKNSRAFHKSLGRWTSGRVLYGYKYNTATKEIEIYEPEAAAVRFIFESYTAGKHIGIKKLAQIMNASDYLPRFQKNAKKDYWTYPPLWHILHHPAYCGGPSAEYPYKIPAIIPIETWEIAQSRLANNQHFKPSNSGKTLYQGRLKCGICGRRLTIGYNGSKTKVYECPGRKQSTLLGGESKCTLPRFKVAELDKKLTGKIKKLCGDPKMLLNYLDKYTTNLKAEQERLKARLQPLDIELEKLEKAKDKLDAMLKVDRKTPEEYMTEIRVINEKVTSIKNRKTDLDPTLVKDIELNGLISKVLADVIKLLKKEVENPSKANPVFAELTHYLGTMLPAMTDKNTDGNLDELPLGGVYADMLGDAFKYFLIYPDKIETKGSITIAKSNITSAHNNEPFGSVLFPD